MTDATTREPARDPQDLERLLVARENAGDVDGMTALFEPDAVIDIGEGNFVRGKAAIHAYFTQLQVTGFGPEKRKFEYGEQRPALLCGELALTSTRCRNGSITTEVARRQADGTWLWVIDRYSVAW
jgi:ketosteroid isomerase-like protein